MPRSRLSLVARLLIVLAGLSAVFAGSLTRSPQSPQTPEAAYRALPALAVPVSSSPVGLEAQAVRLADELRAVPLSEQGGACAVSRLRVSWAAPPPGARHGAHLEPLGPVPGSDTTSVNGIVRCDGSSYGYMGFEAWRDSTGWRLTAVPFLGEHTEDPTRVAATPAHVVAPPVLASADDFAGEIEDYAPYEPQRTCDPQPKPGAAALGELLTGVHPGTRDLGIVRECATGGQSEHKEGRAFDWGVLAERPAEKAAAIEFVALLTAPDADGNQHALARRMGVMYVIWDGRIWSSHRPGDGWRTYSGTSPHTDHVHVSLSWDGAMGRTSFWTEKPTSTEAETVPDGEPPAEPEQPQLFTHADRSHAA